MIFHVQYSTWMCVILLFSSISILLLASSIFLYSTRRCELCLFVFYLFRPRVWHCRLQVRSLPRIMISSNSSTELHYENLPIFWFRQHFPLFLNTPLDHLYLQHLWYLKTNLHCPCLGERNVLERVKWLCQHYGRPTFQEQFVTTRVLEMFKSAENGQILQEEKFHFLDLFSKPYQLKGLERINSWTSYKVPYKRTEPAQNS